MACRLINAKKSRCRWDSPLEQELALDRHWVLRSGISVLDPLYTLSLYGKHFYFRRSTESTLHDYRSDAHSQILGKSVGNYPTGLKFQWRAD